MKRCLALLLILALLLAGVQAFADSIGTVKGGWLRLRSAPSTLGSVIGRYYTGTQVTVHSTSGSWYYVTAPDGKVGYMSRNYVVVGGGVSPVTPPIDWHGTPSGQTGYVTSQNGRGVRLRSSPYSGNSSNVIGLYNVGTKLTVLQRGIGWHYIQIGKQTGFMMAQFVVISGSPVPVPPGPIDPVIPDKNYTAYITSQNGKGVRLRTGPGTNYSLLGTFPVGTQVTVLKELGAWCYISIGSTKKGYMMTTFLTRQAPGPVPPPYVPPVDPVGTLESAQITIQNPIMGDRLYVYVTPDGAQYNVLWYNDSGTYLGSGNGYVVKETDRMHRIRALVNGTNNWAGTLYTTYTDLIGTKVTPVDPPQNPSLKGTVTLNQNVSVNDVLSATVTGCNASALVFTWYVGGQKYAQQNSITITPDMAGKTIQVVVTAAGFSNSLTAVTQVKNVSTSAPIEPVIEIITPPETETVPPVVETVEPSVEHITPVIEPVVPIVEPVTADPAPVVPEETTTPVVEAITPAQDPASPVEPVTPAVESVPPVVEVITPVTESVEPVTNEPESAPVVEQIAPVSEPTQPLVEFITP